MMNSFVSSSFVKPTIKLARWISNIAGNRLIVEVGCGNGELLHKLAKVHNKVLGCDPHSSLKKYYSGFMPLYADQLSIIKRQESLIVAARPDHSGWVSEIPTYMYSDSQLLYLGLENNIKIDWPNIDDIKYTIVEPPNGCDIDIAMVIEHHSKLP